MDWSKQVDGMVDEISDRLIRARRCPVAPPDDARKIPAEQHAVKCVLDDLLAALFPGCHQPAPMDRQSLRKYVARKLAKAVSLLTEHIERALIYQCYVDACKGFKTCPECRACAEDVVRKLIRELPAIRDLLDTDVEAAYEGDPAARSYMEVVQSYPSIHAVTVQRIAHFLYDEKVPLIPRIMTELAHSRTGIDIHPGAHIGKAFFIDHGTGVVIGETCVIGDHVKLYQGVTLGALSFEKDEHGNLVKGIKRHPDVEDHVVIYSGATILGGRTRIGAHSVIGGNVWLTHSVPPYSKVYNQQPKPLVMPEAPSPPEGEPWPHLGGGI